MIDPKQTADLDQARAVITEHLPGMWREIYLKLVSEGFTEEQAMDITKTYITATCSQPSRK